MNGPNENFEFTAENFTFNNLDSNNFLTQSLPPHQTDTNTTTITTNSRNTHSNTHINTHSTGMAGHVSNVNPGESFYTTFNNQYQHHTKNEVYFDEGHNQSHLNHLTQDVQFNGLNGSSTESDDLSRDGRNKRTRATGEALDILMKEFELNPSPNPEIRKRIAMRTGLEEKKVRIWFQNRRAKFRKSGSVVSMDYNNHNNSNLNLNFYNEPMNLNQYGEGDSEMDYNQEQYRESATDMQYSEDFEFDNIPWDLNQNYHFVDIMSLTVGSWKRIKSGHLEGSSLPMVSGLSNLAPMSLNNIMANSTDLIVLISKKNYEINYFFSAIADNSKILFRVFYPLNSIVNCSLSLTKKNPSKNPNSPTLISTPGGGNMGSATNTNKNISNPDINTGGFKTTADNNENNEDNEEDEEDGEEEFSDLKVVLNKSPNFAVYFSDAADDVSSNQWNICEDFSEGKQVSEAYIGSNEIPHILKGSEQSLKLMNSLIMEYNSTNIYPSTLMVSPQHHHQNQNQNQHHQHHHQHNQSGQHSQLQVQQQQQQQQQHDYSHFNQPPNQSLNALGQMHPNTNPINFMSPSGFQFHSNDNFLPTGFTPGSTSDLLMDHQTPHLQNSAISLDMNNPSLNSSNTPLTNSLNVSNSILNAGIPETPDFNSLLNFQNNEEET